MLTTYQGIKTVLKTKLQALKGSDDTVLLAGVYDFPTPEPAGYPVAFLVEDAGEGQILTTHQNEREFQFTLTVEQDINETVDQNTAQSTLLDAVDRIVAAFDQDPYLLDENDDVQVIQVRVLPLQYEWGNRESGRHVAALRIAAVTIVNRYPAA